MALPHRVEGRSGGFGPIRYGSEPARDELKEALAQGVFMHEVPWSVVRDRREAVIKLMAAF